MTTLDTIMQELDRRKVVYNHNEFLLILWSESIESLHERGVPEPYNADIIQREMEVKAEYILRIADSLYRTFDKTIELRFDEYTINNETEKDS